MPDFSRVIRQAYVAILGRDPLDPEQPDHGGLAHWNSEMNSPRLMSEAEMRENLIRSREYAQAHGGTAPPTEPPPNPQPLPPGKDLVAPIRGAFYYGWFPQTWNGPDGTPARYMPTLGRYSSSDRNAVDAHIKAMDYGRINLCAYSWWGQNHENEKWLPLLFDRIEALGSPLRVAVYHEMEGFGNPTPEQLRSDLTYIRDKYVSRDAYARFEGKPMVLVYNADDHGCEVANRWRDAVGQDWHLTLKVFSGWEQCQGKADIWHQYGPSVGEFAFPGSYVISPGYWEGNDSAPSLPRDVEAWRTRVRKMVASGADLQLVISFNEHWEGTATEPCEEWATPSGFGAYLDVLHEV